MAQQSSVQVLSLRRYWIAVFLVSVIFLILFGVAEIIRAPLLTDPSVSLQSRGILSAVIGVLLLVADVWLPVPASIIMIANGALFGILIGTLLSLIGSLGSSLVGFSIGRAGSNLLRRLITTPEYEASELLLKKWGLLAVLVSRPIPIFAETVAIMAGASSTRWTQFAMTSIGGIFPAAFLYALAGATTLNIRTGILIFPIVLLLAGIFWWIGHRLVKLQ